MDELKIVEDNKIMLDECCAQLDKLEARIKELEAFVDNAMSNPMVASMLE